MAVVLFTPGAAAAEGGEPASGTTLSITADKFQREVPGGLYRSPVRRPDYSLIEGSPGLESVRIDGYMPRGWGSEPEDSRLGDGVFVHLGRLERLRELRVEWCHGFTASGLKELAGAPELTSLSLVGCGGITDDDVAALAAALPRLRSLDLGYCGGVTGEVTKVLGKFPELESLGIGGISLSDADVERLQRLEGLSELRVTGSQAIIEGLGGFAPSVQMRLHIENMNDPWHVEKGLRTKVEVADLRQSESVVGLGLRFARFADGDVEAIASLPSVESLDLAFSKGLGDAIEHLGSMSSLTSLNLDYCDGVGEAEVAELKKALPSCKIEHQSLR